MRKYFFLIFLWLLVNLIFTGCLSVKRIERNCDLFSEICITDSKTVTEYRDTILFIDRPVPVPLPPDTVTIHDTLILINNLAYLPLIYREFGLIGVQAKVNASVLDINAFLTDSSVLFQYTDTFRFEEAIQKTSTTDTVVLPPEKYIPAFYKFALWFFVASVLLMIVFALWKFLKVRALLAG